ncbi:jasmonate O-methyltransferase-like [Silene latifolia]|uniref:jasmonate O-methyltransferase-like n=1 Tax=Silene latifolia TaxID=37657 RepID=UPI003D777645
MNILHMTKGDGEFSYSHNSNSQNRVFSYVIKPLLESSVKSILSNEEMKPLKVINVADLGCGVGPTPVSLISTVTTTVHKICRELNWNGNDFPQLRIFMSDLPSNDFNLLFRDVIDGQLHDGHNDNGKPSCFVMGAPGSFYGRLFPCNSLQLVFSNYAIHWLSQVRLYSRFIKQQSL